MSSFTIIQQTSRELRRRILGAFTSSAEADLGMTETNITLSPPSDDLDNAARLSLFLYLIEPNGHLRNQPFLPDRHTGLRFPPLPLELRYLITPLDDNEEVNHLMLGRILQHFHDQPVLDELNDVPLDDSFGGNSNRFRIIYETLSMEQLSHIWHALDIGYRLSVAYCVRIVAIDTARGLDEAKRVEHAFTAVGRHT